MMAMAMMAMVIMAMVIGKMNGKEPLKVIAMKKIISLIAIGLMPFLSISAQNDSKNYLPEQGDMAFGINVKPVLKYAGNIFNGTSGNSLDNLGGEPVSGKEFDSEILPDVSIMGKYMLNDSWGIRANVGLMFRKDMDRKYVKDDKNAVLNPFDETKLIDQKNTSKNGMSMMLGAEYRKGNDRIQGVLGMGVLLGFYSDKVSYNYANALTTINQQPTSAWSAPASNGYRILSQRTDNNVFYGVTGSAGVEWFVAPKVSLGAEVNLSLYGISGGQLYTDSEGYNVATKQVETRTDLDSPGSNKFRFGTENLGGSLYMAFYF